MIMARTFELTCGEDCLFLDSSKEPLEIAEIGLTNNSHYSIVADLLRANNLSEKPLARQIEIIIGEELLASTLSPEETFFYPDLASMTVHLLVSLADRLGIQISQHQGSRVVLLEAAAKLVNRDADYLIDIMVEYRTTHFEEVSTDHVIRLLRHAVTNQVGMPIINYLCLKLSEHPDHGQAFTQLVRSMSPGKSSAALALHLYSQELHDKQTGLDKKLKFIRLLQKNEAALREAVTSHEELSIEELFEYLNENHPYQIEYILNQFQDAAGHCDSF